MSQSIQLQTSAILNVPLDKYDKDFTFIVNGESFHTSKFVADLLSRKISNYHSVDPTINKININTKNRGNFAEFLKLYNFEEIHFSVEESKFIFEIIKQLETPKIELDANEREITIDNVVDFLIKDENFQEIFPKTYKEEVEFISTNFSEIIQSQKEKIKALSVNTIENIINNANLQLENEDELIKFINDLYKESPEYSILYDYVLFSNVESSTIDEFLNIFDINDLNQSIWYSISTRLKQEINKKSDENNHKKRYKNRNVNNNNNKNDDEKDTFIEYKADKTFEGIFNFLKNNAIIKNEIKVTASSNKGGNLEQIIQSDFPNNNFFTYNVPYSWVCIEFIKHKVIPTHYTIRSNNWDGRSEPHPRNWEFEGSIDSNNWVTLDSQTECSYLKGRNRIYTISIQNNNQSYKYFRIRQTGMNWNNHHCLCFNCIELYGKLTSA